MSTKDLAEEEPMPKRLRHCVISDHVYNEEFEELLHGNWCNYRDIKSGNLEVISKPFRVCKISNFLASEEFIDGLKTELLDVKCRRSSIDLYQFEQTGDLAYVDSPNLQLLYTAFQIELAIWMERNTKIELNNKISMSSSCYCDTDYLLCHDDNMGERRIAYILYLSKDWTAADGGALDLFDTDEHGLPRNVVRSLVPEYNSLVFFEVADNSYHQVAEVTSAEKSRWSINGWFEGPLRKSNRLPRPEIVLNYIEPTDMDIEIGSWITLCYLLPDIVKEIQQDIEHESYTFLSKFLIEDVYKKLLAEITSEIICWKKVGPADVRNYEVADEETLPEFLKSFYNVFKSISMFRLLKHYTELDLVPVQETMKPKMTIELQRWSQGCYTLISDKSTTKETSIASNTETNTTGEKKESDIKNENNKEPRAKDIEKTKEKEADKLEQSIACKSSEDSQSTKSHSGNKKNTPRMECNTPLSDKEYEDIDDEDVQKVIVKKKKLKKVRPKKKETESQTSSSDLEDSPTSPEDILDRSDSEVSDIGDYLSDPLDYLMEVQEEAAQENETYEPGSLDVIMQFHTGHVPEEQTIDYVDPKEKEGALIHVPPKDNHLCLVYKTLSTCRVHKYVNHYCQDYFYNLVCTYYE
ncbi:hypothetical protein KPH14_007125 [Odynerus spinipes]|uniref:uS12 prolyl 3-hydroxylase n=1 Tax=Odynerus spinipes TaxID=1348599 RepID=A0AAD9RRW0_9HYME|nr:hypothetical protein KPH14_007125 [Odynerus spinipes]